MEILILGIFGAALFFALFLKVKVVYALLFGLFLFVIYAALKGESPKKICQMCFVGIKTTRGVLTLFILLGLLTSAWRAGGTIPLIVNYAVNFIHPGSFIGVTFLLNAAMSLVTGTALGTAATMGVICATMGETLGMPSYWIGGAILAGVYFGNRISPISSMALLTANITQTDIYDNIKNMLKTTWLPFILSVAIYLVAGLNGSQVVAEVNIHQLFAEEFKLSFLSIIPAVVIVALSILRVASAKVLLASTIAASILAVIVENHKIIDVLKMFVFGYRANHPELYMLNGGGVISMANVFFIVVIAGCYSGIFKNTPLLSPIHNLVQKISKNTNPFFAKLVTATIGAMVACNQTLTIILTHQLTKELSSEKDTTALDLYDTAVVVIALVPWSVATVIVLATANAPSTSILCACFLYLVPLCRLIFKKGTLTVFHKIFIKIRIKK